MYPGFVTCFERASAKLFSGISSVIVEPAAISDPSPTVTGAMRFVLQPINASLPTIVLNLLTPS